MSRYIEVCVRDDVSTTERGRVLERFARRFSATAQPQKHYILSAEEDCVEFIGPGWGHDLRIEIHQPSAEVR